MAKLNSVNHIHPIFEGNIVDGKFRVNRLLGTSFNVGGNFFLTAGHCLMSMEDKFQYAIAVPEENKEPINLLYHKIKHYEIVQEHDCALIQINHFPKTTFFWQLAQLNNLDDVSTFGYPFGFDKSKKNLVIRATKGHIIYYGKIPGIKLDSKGYELSFMCPRGLSGGPLIHVVETTPFVTGMVIGNASTEIEVFSETEINESAGEKHTFSKVEVVKYGVAIQSSTLANIKFDLIEGNNLKTLLTQYGLITR